MDPFSLAVGIASLIGLTAHTIHVTTSYVHEVKNGKAAAAELLTELNILHLNLSRLDSFLKSEEAIQPFNDTSALASTTFKCRDKLVSLRLTLDSSLQSRLSRLKWPLDSKEHRRTIEELKAYAQSIHFALTVDGCSLLSKTSVEVSNVLKHQLATFELLEHVNYRTVSIERSLEEQANAIRDQHSADEREKVLNWISIVKHEQKHHNVRQPRLDGTGEWFLETEEYQRWFDGQVPSSRFLWCHGIQGSGKSIIVSLVIDNLSAEVLNQNVGLAYFYFDYREQEIQSAEVVIASVLRQLATAKPTLPQSVSDLYHRLHGHRQPQRQDLEHAVSQLCDDFDRIFIVIDALDECAETSSRKALLEFLERLRGKTTISVLVTSRPHLDDFGKIIETSSKVMIEADDSDIRAYVVREIDRSDAVDDLDDDFKIDIIEKVVSGAQKMFLLAVLQVQAICHETTSVGEMEEALETMPHGLDDALEETLQRVQRQPEKRKMLGMNALMWISHAMRPLKVAELMEALAIKMGATSLNPKFQRSQTIIVACCLGLVTVDKKSSVIRLVHYSVQEYFREHQSRIFPLGEKRIAEHMITYLISEDFASGSRREEKELRALICDHPFTTYATRHWGHHVRKSNDGDTEKLTLQLLRSDLHRACSIQIAQYVLGRRKEYWQFEEAQSRNGLHVAAAFGLEGLAKQLVASGECEVDSVTKMGTTALIEAAASGHRDFVRMLLEYKADLRKENWYGTALHCAAEAGRLESISELLGTGVEVDIRDDSGRTPLHCASISGHSLAMRLLLENDAEVDALHNHYTPLLDVVLFKHPPDLVEMLLAKGASTESRTVSGSTALHHAATMDLEEVLILLLNHGAETNASNRHGHTALHCAADKNHDRLVEILLKHGAPINAQTNDGQTALHCAAQHGGDSAVRTLLESGAKMDIADNVDLVPLHLAAMKQHRSVVGILSSAGADIHASSKDGITAFDFAFENSDHETARLLVQHGATPKSGPQQYWLI